MQQPRVTGFNILGEICAVESKTVAVRPTPG